MTSVWVSVPLLLESNRILSHGSTFWALVLLYYHQCDSGRILLLSLVPLGLPFPQKIEIKSANKRTDVRMLCIQGNFETKLCKAKKNASDLQWHSGLKAELVGQGIPVDDISKLRKTIHGLSVVMMLKS